MYLALCRSWRQAPPLHRAVAALAGYQAPAGDAPATGKMVDNEDTAREFAGMFGINLDEVLAHGRNE